MFMKQSMFGLEPRTARTSVALLPPLIQTRMVVMAKKVCSDYWSQLALPRSPLVWSAHLRRVFGTADLMQRELYEGNHDNVSFFYIRLLFKKMGQPSLFLFIFVLFKYKFNLKTCRRQQDSNSDRWSRRRACWPLDHHHGLQPLTAFNDSFLYLFGSNLSKKWIVWRRPRADLKFLRQFAKVSNSTFCESIVLPVQGKNWSDKGGGQSRVAAIAQWIRLRLPSCGLGSNPEHNIYTSLFLFKFELYCGKGRK